MSSSHRRDEYARKLKTPQWAEFRERIFSEDREFGEYPCEYCGDLTWGRYHAHHRGYVSGREPWQYNREEMSILCRRCHDDIHRWLKRIESAISGMDRRLASAIRFAGICFGHLSRDEGGHIWGYQFSAMLKSLSGGYKIGDEREGFIFAYRDRYRPEKSFADFRNSLLRFMPLELDMIESHVVELSIIGDDKSNAVANYLWSLESAAIPAKRNNDRGPVLIGEIASNLSDECLLW